MGFIDVNETKYGRYFFVTARKISSRKNKLYVVLKDEDGRYIELIAKETRFEGDDIKFWACDCSSLYDQDETFDGSDEHWIDTCVNMEYGMPLQDPDIWDDPPQEKIPDSRLGEIFGIEMDLG